MKARVKATGVIVEVSLSHIVHDGGRKIIWYNTPQGASFTEDELEFIDTEENFDYWTRLEHQAAIAAMQGMLNNSLLTTGLLKAGKSHEDFVDEVTSTAIRYAHALVEKMKEKGGK